MKKQQGIVLVMVLVVIVLLTLVAGFITTTRRTDAALTFNLIDSVKGQALVQAGVEYTVLRLLSIKTEEDWRPERGNLTWTFDEVDLTISVQDARGLINLNRAPNNILQLFFENMGKTEEEAAELVDLIQDWRDKNKNHRLNGAEDDEYESLGLAYGAKDANFQSIEELRLLPNMKDTFFQQIKPYLTIQNSGGKVIPELAPEEVLRALPNLDESVVDDLLFNRHNTTELNQIKKINIGQYFIIRVDINQADFNYSGQANIQLRGQAFNVLTWQYGLKSKKITPLDNNNSSLENN